MKLKHCILFVGLVTFIKFIFAGMTSLAGDDYILPDPNWDEAKKKLNLDMDKIWPPELLKIEFVKLPQGIIDRFGIAFYYHKNHNYEKAKEVYSTLAHIPLKRGCKEVVYGNLFEFSEILQHNWKLLIKQMYK